MVSMKFFTHRVWRMCFLFSVAVVSIALMVVYTLELKYHIFEQYQDRIERVKLAESLPELDSKYYANDKGLFEKDWALSVTQHQQRKSSQGPQDGALAWIFYNIGTTNKYYVEFGFDIPFYSYLLFGIQGSNAYQMYIRGWKGLFLDGGNWNPLINLQKLWISASTIVQDLKDKGVPQGADFISVDIDSSDCFTARAIACDLKPRVMTVEYNCNFPTNSTLANMGVNYSWEDDRLYGCAIGAHAAYARECGYAIVDVVKCLDVILVRNDLLQNTKIHELSYWNSYGGLRFHRTLASFQKNKNTEVGKHLCDFEVWQATKNFQQCSGQTAIDIVNRLNVQL